MSDLFFSLFKNMNRRSFLTALSTTGFVGWLGGHQGNAQENPEVLSEDSSAILDSFPVLQNPAPDGMTVVWALKRPATGYVEWGETPELGQIARATHLGMEAYEERFLSIRISGLEPNRTYFYRTVTIPIDFNKATAVLAGEPVQSGVYSFQTSGETPEKGTASFAVINDTHQNDELLAVLTRRLQEIQADYTLWNGDLMSYYPNADEVVRSIMRPANAPFAVKNPLLFLNGNHDKRGQWARHLPKALTLWEQENPKFRGLGRNFVVRQGALAMIGLDTGEDKPDAHPVWAGLTSCEPYRILQTEWLAEVLESPQVKSAPFVVAYCHIPLFDPDPEANPGDIMEKWASYQRPCQKLWGPLLEKYGVQLVITAHQHRYRFDAPGENRSWAQIVGGGSNLASGTLIFGQADAQKLKIKVEKAQDQSVLGEFEFAPRS